MRPEEDDDMEPETPVVKPDANRGKEDPDEVLLGDDEIDDEEE